MTTSPIPIANIYYLFCYAWDLFREGRGIFLGSAPSPDLPNLLARVLANGTATLLRRGLDRAYQPADEDLATVRGHIDLSRTILLKTRQVRRIHCYFDELSTDTMHNRVLKASLLRLSRAPGLDTRVSRELIELARRFHGVADLTLTAGSFARIQLHRNNAHYELLLQISRLAFDSLLPDPSGEGFRFHSVLDDEIYMHNVFEKFVRNFYRREQRTFEVEPFTISWDADAKENGGHCLPQMKVDVYLRGAERHIIIDTKYYVDTLQTNRGSVSFHSGHLYQLFSYLKNAAADPALASAEGMLLYPRVDQDLDYSFIISGHPIRIATVNLAEDWPKIEQRLLALLADARPN